MWQHIAFLFFCKTGLACLHLACELPTYVCPLGVTGIFWDSGDALRGVISLQPH